MVMLTAENRLGSGMGILRNSTEGIHPCSEGMYSYSPSRDELAAVRGGILPAGELVHVDQDEWMSFNYRSFSGGYTDEQVDEMNRLAELEFFEKNPISDEMVALLEQCMLEEDRAFVDGTVELHDYLVGTISGPTFQAPLQTLDELHAWRGASVGDVVFVADELTAYILADVGKWLSFGTSMVSAHPVERTTDGMVTITTPIDVPPSKKILASRTPSHEFLLERRAENDLRRRNEGKKILSSRG